jgi:L-rhamnose isomerase/sugar isomerase
MPRCLPDSGFWWNTNHLNRPSTILTLPIGACLCFFRALPGRKQRSWSIPAIINAAQNIEQIVAWLLSEDMLGGFHFNDRRYADDDLTLGSIDPYQVFRIFHEIHYFEWETGKRADIAYMVDQSHNLKGKIEETIQTATMAQQLFAKAALVNHEELSRTQSNCDLVAAESLLQDAFNTDVRPVIQDWRDSKGLPRDPLTAFRQSGYMERITKDRAARNSQSITSYA